MPPPAVAEPESSPYPMSLRDGNPEGEASPNTPTSYDTFVCENMARVPMIVTSLNARTPALPYENAYSHVLQDRLRPTIFRLSRLGVASEHYVWQAFIPTLQALRSPHACLLFRRIAALHPRSVTITSLMVKETRYRLDINVLEYDALGRFLVWSARTLIEGFVKFNRKGAKLILPPDYAPPPSLSQINWRQPDWATEQEARNVCGSLFNIFAGLLGQITHLLALYSIQSQDCLGSKYEHWTDLLIHESGAKLPSLNGLFYMLIAAELDCFGHTNPIHVGTVMTPTCSWRGVSLKLSELGIPVWLKWGPHLQIEQIRPIVDTVLQPFFPSPLVISSIFSKYSDWKAGAPPPKRRRLFEHTPELPVQRPPVLTMTGLRRLAKNQPAASPLDIANHVVKRHSGQQPGESVCAFLTWRLKIRLRHDESDHTEEIARRRELELMYAQGQCPAPGVSTKVYEWRREAPGLWTRFRVARRDYESVWQKTVHSMRTYDSLHDEWDVCWLLDPSEVDDITAVVEDDGQDFPNDGGVLLRGESGELEEGEIAPIDFLTSLSRTLDLRGEEFNDGGSLANHDDTGMRASAEMSSLQRMAIRYGFIHSVPLTAAWQTAPQEVIVNCIKIIMMHTFESRAAADAIPQNSLPSVVHFFSLFSTFATTTAGSDAKTLKKRFDAAPPTRDWSAWDLNKIDHPWRLIVEPVDLRIGDQDLQTWYKIYPRERRYRRHWSLLVADSIGAALCLRRAKALPPDQLPQIVDMCCRALIEAGIRWTTALVQDSGPADLSECRPRTHAKSPTFLRDCFNWSHIEYKWYLERRRYILQSPQGRHAFRHGTLLAYLAGKEISSLAAIQGPNLDPEFFFPEHGSCNGQPIVLDHLTPLEIEGLIGTFMAKNNRGNDMTEVHMSYWPPLDIWDRSLYGRGIWTKRAQDWVDDRQRELATDPRPRNRGQWRALLNPISPHHLDKALQRRTGERLKSIYAEYTTPR